MICEHYYKRKALGRLNETRIRCGKCYACRMKKAQEWTFRIQWEDKMHHFRQFVTLTYSEDNVDYKVSKHDGVKRKNANYKDGPQFINSIRQAMKREGHPDKVRYFMIVEYGKKRTRHPHYHIILWGCPYNVNRLQRIWGKGMVHVGKIEPKSIAYVSGYTWKRQDKYTNKHGLTPERCWMSKGSKKSGLKGLGYNYVPTNKWLHYQTQDDTVQLNGYTIKMPRYLKDEIWPVNNIKEHLNTDTGEIEEIGRRRVSDRIHKINDWHRLQMRIKTNEEICDKWEEKVKLLSEKEPELTLEEIEKELLHRQSQRAKNNMALKRMGTDKLDY